MGIDQAQSDHRRESRWKAAGVAVHGVNIRRVRAANYFGESDSGNYQELAEFARGVDLDGGRRRVVLQVGANCGPNRLG